MKKFYSAVLAASLLVGSVTACTSPEEPANGQSQEGNITSQEVGNRQAAQSQNQQQVNQQEVEQQNQDENQQEQENIQAAQPNKQEEKKSQTTQPNNQEQKNNQAAQPSKQKEDTSAKPSKEDEGLASIKQKIKLGLTEKQVKELFGAPDVIDKTNKQFKQWRYDFVKEGYQYKEKVISIDTAGLKNGNMKFQLIVEFGDDDIVDAYSTYYMKGEEIMQNRVTKDGAIEQSASAD